MTAELELRQDVPGVMQHFQEDPTGGRLVAWAQAASAANQLARALVRTSFVPANFKGNDGDATAAIMAGDEIGLSPLASLRSFYLVHGTPALYAKAMVALVQSRGHEVWTDTDTPDRVVVCGQRRGSQRIETADWSMTRARTAQYTSNKKYQSNPQEMLWAKAATEICKKIASDVLNGIPSVEETELENQPTTTVEAKPRKTAVTRAKPAAVEPPEPSFDEPEPTLPEPASDDAEAISLPQSKKMHALFRDKGFVDRDDSLSFVSQTIDREVGSTKELSKAEASTVIEALVALADVEPEPES